MEMGLLMTNIDMNIDMMSMLRMEKSVTEPGQTVQVLLRWTHYAGGHYYIISSATTKSAVKKKYAGYRQSLPILPANK